jgi:hypothetical protein
VRDSRRGSTFDNCGRKYQIRKERKRGRAHKRLGAETVLERFPIRQNHVIEKDSLKFEDAGQVLIEKLERAAKT